MIPSLNTAWQVGDVAVAATVILGLVRYVPRIVRKLDAIDALTKAQLSENGGGSLIDKINRLVGLSSSVSALGDQMRRNHEEAKKQWESLHLRDGDFDARMKAIEALAQNFREELPPRLLVQDANVKRLDSLERRMDRVEDQVFPPSRH